MYKLALFLSLLLTSFCCFSQSKYVSEATKSAVFTRDGGQCQCCGSYDNIEYDHVIPFSCGGTSDASNIQLLCLKCNRSKSNSCFCKVHDKKVGNNCCDGKEKVNQSSESQKSASESTQCTGTTKKGTRCRKMTTNSNGRCYLH
jgi:hypothetical protein